jgi:hypothetical protein
MDSQMCSRFQVALMMWHDPCSKLAVKFDMKKGPLLECVHAYIRSSKMMICGVEQIIWFYAWGFMHRSIY